MVGLSVTSPIFWALTLVFLGAIFSSWYSWGSWLLQPLRQRPLPHVVLAFIVGLVAWGLQGYILGYLNLRGITYGYILVGWWWLWQQRHAEKERLQALFQTVFHQPWILLMVFIGSYIQLIPVVSSGLVWHQALSFFGVNAYDGVLHVAYIQSLMRSVPPQEPGALSMALVNYHYWSDLVMAELARIWQLPPLHLYFQWLPTVISLLTAGSFYVLVRSWGGSKSWATWAVIFNYTVGDLAYALSWWFHRAFWWHVAAIDNGSTQFLNVPHTFAKMIMLGGVIALGQWWRTKTLRWGLLAALLLGSLTGFKIYYGMFAALGLTLVVVADIVRTRFKSVPWQSLVVLASCGVLALAIFLPTNRHAGGLFYSPLEWPKLLLGPDHLDVREWWLRRQNYDAAHSWKGIVYQDAQAVLICLLVMYGTRVLGFLPNRKALRQWGWVGSLFFIPGTLVFTWLGLFTLQESGLFNVFNFFVVACVPLSLVTSFWLSEWWGWRWHLGKGVALVFMAITIPKVVHSTWYYTDLVRQFKPEQQLTLDSALTWQRLAYTLPADAVLQGPLTENWNRITPALAFLSQRSTYLTGVSMLESHNQPVTDRQAEVKAALAATTPDDLSAKLKALHVTHLYVPKTHTKDVPGATGLPIVAELTEGTVYQLY